MTPQFLDASYEPVYDLSYEGYWNFVLVGLSCVQLEDFGSFLANVIKFQITDGSEMKKPKRNKEVKRMERNWINQNNLKKDEAKSLKQKAWKKKFETKSLKQKVWNR